MADITMCEGHGCPNKDTCYRFTAEVNQYRQAYFTHIPYVPGMGCEMFTPNFIKEKDEPK